MNINSTIFNVIFTVFSMLALVSCKSKVDEGDKNTVEQQDIDDPSLPFDQRVKNYVEQSLRLDANENYRMKVYQAHLNDDEKEDVVITVNRFDHAVKEANSTNQAVKSQELDFFGRHNYIIIYSSKTNKFSQPIAMASTPQRELKVTFENISSDNHKDIVVDYAIRNSQFRKIFLMINDSPVFAFHWNIYDNWGKDNVVAQCFKYDKGSFSEVKDIVIYFADIKNIGPDDDYNSIEPEITCTDKLMKRFFYNSKDGKYYTPN